MMLPWGNSFGAALGRPSSWRAGWLARGVWLGALGLAFGCGGSTTSGQGGSAGNAGSAGSGVGGNGGVGGTSSVGGSAGTGTAGFGGVAGAAGVGGQIVLCDVPSDCVVVPQSCCGACGVPSRGDALALNRAWASDYRQGVCENTGCPACDRPRDPTLIATCSAGRCELIDLLQHPSTACKTDQDCVLRTNECCNCGGAQDIEHLIAVNVMSSYPSLVCDPNEACDPCVDPPPDRARAFCASGHCMAEWALD